MASFAGTIANGIANTFTKACVDGSAKRAALAVVAGLLAATSSYAAGTADAAISISSFKVLDASGTSVALDAASWLKPYSSAQTLEQVHGENSLSYQSDSNRHAIVPVCSDATGAAGPSLTGSACTSGMPGTMNSEAASALFNSSAAAHGQQYFSFMLPTGYSFEISGRATAHASSSGVPDSSAGLAHVSSADAGIVIGPQQFELRGFSANVTAASNAARSFVESTQSTPFSYSTTNPYPYAISVLLSWSANALVGNAVSAVPEASTVIMMLAGLLLIRLRKRQGVGQPARCGAIGFAAAA